MSEVEGRARAYVYEGNWVVDCPRGCNNTEFVFDLRNPLDPRSPRDVPKGGFHCSYCRLVAPAVELPRDADEIMRVLAVRPIPNNRNWYPEDHPVALRFNVAHGQTVAQLREENAEHGVEVPS